MITKKYKHADKQPKL